MSGSELHETPRARPGRQTTLPATIDRAARRPPPSDAAGRPIAALDGHMLLHARRSDGGRLRRPELGMINCRIKQTLIGIWGTCRADSGTCGSAELVHLLETVFCTSIELNSWRERRVCNELWAGTCRSHLRQVVVSCVVVVLYVCSFD